MIDVTPVNTTVTVVDPVHAAHPPEDAVMVADPVTSPSTCPEACQPIRWLDHWRTTLRLTSRFFWLPSS